MQVILLDERGLRRNPNFSSDEVLKLLKLVQKNQEIILDERLDFLVKEKKEAAWKSIETEFNHTSNIYFRDLKSLKTKFQDVKTRYSLLKKSWRIKPAWKESEKILGAIIKAEKSVRCFRKDFVNPDTDSEKIPDLTAESIVESSDDTYEYIEYLTEDDPSSPPEIKPERDFEDIHHSENLDDFKDEEQPEAPIPPETKRKRPGSPMPILPLGTGSDQSRSFPRNILIEAQTQYFRDKNRREEQREMREQEEHKLRLEQMKLNLKKTALEIKALQNSNMNVI